MLTLFANPRLLKSTGNVNSCSRPSVLKFAAGAAAAELLCLAGESVGGVVLLNGNDKETLTAICKLNDGALRARSSAAVKAVSVADLYYFKRFVKTQCALGLNTTNGKPRCDKAARRAPLWTHRAL